VVWFNLSQRLGLVQPFPKVGFGSTFPKGCGLVQPFPKVVVWFNLSQRLWFGSTFPKGWVGLG